MSTPDAPLVDWAWAGSALAGESGDLHVVVPFAGGVLAALIDGLGHGPEAAAASRAAVPVLREGAAEPVDELMRRCHAALRHTRGAAISLASFDGRSGSMTWASVGNVDCLLLRAPGAVARPDEAISMRGGVVGYQLPPLRLDTLLVEPGDTLVMVTDGIRSDFSVGEDIARPPADCAQAILRRHGKGNDDAHVLVVRYLGGGR